jgi:hypothetical protein
MLVSALRARLQGLALLPALPLAEVLLALIQVLRLPLAGVLRLPEQPDPAFLP